MGVRWFVVRCLLFVGRCFCITMFVVSCSLFAVCCRVSVCIVR